MTLEECAASTGKQVTYSLCDHCDWTETGVIVRVGANFAFVRFGSPTPKACDPSDLTLVTPSEGVAG